MSKTAKPVITKQEKASMHQLFRNVTAVTRNFEIARDCSYDDDIAGLATELKAWRGELSKLIEQVDEFESHISHRVAAIAKAKPPGQLEVERIKAAGGWYENGQWVSVKGKP